jgi:ribonuclease E
MAATNSEPVRVAAVPEAATAMPPPEAAPPSQSVARERAALPAPAPDPAELERVLKESGLELVQTRPGSKAELPAEAEFVPARRERRPPPPELNQPLVQVETRKEDASTPT